MHAKTTTRSIGKTLLIAASTVIVAGAVSIGSAHATPVYNEPISVSATFDDGTTLTGEFQINQYGYANSAPWSFSTTAGHSENATPIAAYNFLSTNGSAMSVATPPNTYEIQFFNGAYSESLDFTFAHALNIGGPDPIIAGIAAYNPDMPNSGECAGYSCSVSDERLIASGVAYVPEPASAALLGISLLGFGVMTRNRSARNRAARRGTKAA